MSSSLKSWPLSPFEVLELLLPVSTSIDSRTATNISSLVVNFVSCIHGVLLTVVISSSVIIRGISIISTIIVIVGFNRHTFLIRNYVHTSVAVCLQAFSGDFHNSERGDW